MANRTLNESNLENIQSEGLTIKSKQILSDSTNIHSKNLQTNSNVSNTSAQQVQSRQHIPSTLAAVLRHKESIRDETEPDITRVDSDIVRMIHEFQQSMSRLSSDERKKQDQVQQRTSYNARQTPLIPLIADLDPALLAEYYRTEDDSLLMDMLKLINTSNEDCSFFEQFQI